ncbi:MAG: hypothetical protein ACI3W6_04970 [Clostridia bacterium]
MNLVIISGAARPQRKSNTAKIIEAFQKGYEESGGHAEVWYLSDRTQWEPAAKAFEENNNILIALPLYVENIPGILLEFLSGLTPKKNSGTKLSFLLQGGFPEASQSRCCEAYLEILPSQLGCEYGGTLLKGDLFGLGLTGEKQREKLLAPFTDMGRYFGKTGCFEKAVVDDFAGPEYMAEKDIKMFNRFGRPIQRVFMGHISKKLGCKERLDARPYDAFVK